MWIDILRMSNKWNVARAVLDRLWLQSLHNRIKKLLTSLSPSKTICVICLIESRLKVMKNAFYFILKALLVLKIFIFLSRLFGHVGKTA